MSIQLTPKESELLEFYGKLAEDSINPSTFTSLGMRIEHWAEMAPNKDALFFEDNSWIWKSINEEANKIANYLHNLGLNPGEPVAIMMENSPEFLFITGGISKIKGISALINVNLRKQPLIHIMNISEPKYIIVDDECLLAIQGVVSNLTIEKNKIFVVSTEKHKKHDFMDLSDELKTVSIENPKTIVDFKYGDVCSYIYTSGTTGFPKAVMIKHVQIGTF